MFIMPACNATTALFYILHQFIALSIDNVKYRPIIRIYGGNYNLNGQNGLEESKTVRCMSGVSFPATSDVDGKILRHLVGTEIMQHRESSAPYIRLFGQYRNEWMSVVRQAELNGYAWAKMIGPNGSMMEGESRASA